MLKLDPDDPDDEENAGNQPKTNVTNVSLGAAPEMPGTGVPASGPGSGSGPGPGPGVVGNPTATGSVLNETEQIHADRYKNVSLLLLFNCFTIRLTGM